MKQRPITMVTEQGARLVRVPLGRHGEKGEAILSLEDWSYLLEKGFTGNLFATNGYVMAGRSGYSGNHVVVARLLLQAPAGIRVEYKDGNPFNLRRENLRLSSGIERARIAA